MTEFLHRTSKRSPRGLSVCLCVFLILCLCVRVRVCILCLL